MAVTERTRRAGSYAEVVRQVLRSQAQGIGFAIPSNIARDVAGQLIKSGHVTNSHRAAIGARVATATGQDGRPAGVAIVSVTQGGLAAQAGLRPRDVIRSASRTPTPDATSLAQVLAAARPGQTVSVTVARDAGTLPVQVRLGEPFKVADHHAGPRWLP